MQRSVVEKAMGAGTGMVLRSSTAMIMPLFTEDRKPRRVWWRDMKKADAKHVNRITEAARRNYVAGRLLAGDCPRAISFSERRAEMVTENSQAQREQLLEKYGMLLSSTGEFIADEEYEGQKEAYRSCSNILDYLGKLEQVDLLTVLRYGFMNKWLTFPVEKTQKDHLGRVTNYEHALYEGDATCFDFSVDGVSPFLDKHMQVMIDVQITADIFYLLMSRETAWDDRAARPCVREVVHPMKVQHKYCVRVAFNANDGGLKLKSITELDENAAATGWPLDMLLVPVVRSDETEAFCEFVTAYLLREKYSGDVPRHYRAYHSGMSLPHEHRITLGNTVMARIFFYEGTATCYDDGEVKEIPVFPGTVWIDPVAIEHRTGKWHRLAKGKHVGKDILRKKAEFHEGFHWYTAAPHFCLLRCMDELKGKPAMCYSLTYEVDRKKGNISQKREAKSPVAYFEMLDDRCEPRIAMPRKVVCSRVEAMIEEQNAAGRERISWTQIIDTLADEFLTSKEATKYRLIELGYTDAQGARNWVSTMNGGFYCAEYVPPRGMERNQTYEISRLDGLLEHKRNPSFRKLLQTFPFAYVDGHYIIDDPKYVVVRSNGARLTEYALTHMDECCIPFRKIASKRVYNAAHGFLCYETEMVAKSGVMAWEAAEEMRKKQREVLLFNQEVEEFKKKHQDSDFPTVLNEHMMNSRLSEFQIANRMGISHHTLGKYRTGEAVPDVFMALTLIIALELRGGYRRHLFSLLEKNIKDGVEKNIIDAILDSNQYMLPIEEWDVLIEEVYPTAFKSGFILTTEQRRNVISELKKAGTLQWSIRMLAS